MSKYYEYIEHTADVIVHAWGKNVKEAFQNGAKGMFGYMTDLDRVEERASIILEASFEPYSTKEEMLYRFLDECLFQFSVQDYFIMKRIDLRELDDRGFTAIAYGDNMDLRRHTQGTEVKAITMHGLEIRTESEKVDLYFLLDI
jgi:SHS2 domain-containing protein